MRKQNSEFKTAFTSEAGRDLKNTDYFGFVELDDFACYVIADGIDEQTDAVSARLAVGTAVSAFLEAPSMKKRTMQACLGAANRALIEAKSKKKLKASILIVLTDYVRIRYGQAGNIRLRLCRNGFTQLRSLDQSLTADLVREEKVEPDKVAVHEERNNLYAYLGKEKEFYPFISKKFKLLNGDMIALYTRGIWENVDEGELNDAFEDISEEPGELVDNVEELLLSRQPEELGKYTFAALFINKVFTDPNKKRRIRRILMIIIPILLVLVVLTAVIFIRHRKREEKRIQMEMGYTDTIEYVQADNYVRALERCQEAAKLAEELKNARMQKELGNYQKLIETVLAAQEQLEQEKYEDAQKLYQEASNRAAYVDNTGLDYINDKLSLSASYIAVYDLISLGDTLALNLQYDKAEEKYLEAKVLAGKIYFDMGRTMAMDALEKLYEDQKVEKEAEEEERKAQLAQQESGANYTAKGDTAFAQGDYESAKVYYSSARQVYEDMGDGIQSQAAEEKLAAVEEKISQRDEKMQEAESFVKQAEAASDALDFVTAKTCYLLAKDIYASVKMEDKVEEITRKMEVAGYQGRVRRRIIQETEEQRLSREYIKEGRYMAVGRQFDMKEYIEKRMMGLEEPEERKLFKEVVGEVLLNLYEYNRKAYESLEKRILDEYSPAQNQYAVYVSITERSRCDITDTFLNPMCREDLEKRQISGQDIRKSMEEKQELVVDTVFFKGSASETYGLLSQGERIFHGTIRTDKRTYGADFSLRQNRKYLQMVEELYPVFEFNSRTWLTVCTAYLTKMLDICLSSEEAVGEDEEILEIEVDFEEYGGQIQYDMVPLWNLLELTEKTSTYPIPCVDQIHYEHRIFARRLRSDCEYLIRNRDTEVTGIRRQKGDLYIICPEEQPCEWHLYQAAAPDGRERYAYPVLSNQYRESFSGRVTEMFQRSIKTRAELGRLIEAFDYGTYVTYQGIRTESLVPPECIPCNYNMDGFIADEFHTGSHRPVLVIEFSQVDSRNFLTEDIMSFLVTQVQRVFPDYHCVGSLIQGLPV